MYDPVHHAESTKISALLKGIPAKVCYHLCDTAFSAVVHLNLIGVCVGGWCLGCSDIFYYKIDKYLEGSILCSLWCRSNVSLEESDGGVCLVRNIVCMPALG